MEVTYRRPRPLADRELSPQVYLSPYLIELFAPNSGGESTETSGLRNGWR